MSLRNAFNISAQNAPLSAAEQKQVDRALLQAVQDGDLEQVKDALLNGASKEARSGESGYTPLLLAVYSTQDHITEYLLTLGVDKKAVNTEHANALHLAVNNAQAPPIVTLARAGVPIDARDQDGCTPLMRAIEDGDREIAQTLLNLGADPAIPDRTGKTPLQMAQVRSGTLRKKRPQYRDIIKMLAVSIHAREEAKYAPFTEGVAAPVKPVKRVSFRKKTP